MLLDKIKSRFPDREPDMSKSELDLEKNDLLAIIIAAFTSMLPVMFIVFSLFAFFIFIIFFR